MHIPVKSNKPHEKGYILIEVSIVVIVLSLAMAVMVPIYNTYQQRNAVFETKQRIDVISKAFSSYAQTRWRLPCPADSMVASGTQFGVERSACDVNVPDAHGIVPYRTLGIPEQYVKDGYGNFFTYVVSPDFTADNRLGIQLDQVNIRLSHLVGEKRSNSTGVSITGTDKFALLPRAQFCAPLVNNGTDLQVTQDGTTLFSGTVRDTTNILRTANPDANLNRDNAVTSIAFALISHGENGTGAYQANGLQSPSSAIGTSEEITSNNTNRLIQVESDFSNAEANSYDDTVSFYTQDEIYALAGRSSCEHL